MKSRAVGLSANVAVRVLPEITILIFTLGIVLEEARSEPEGVSPLTVLIVTKLIANASAITSSVPSANFGEVDVSMSN